MSFELWLEETKPLDIEDIEEDASNPAVESLDSLDSIFLSIIYGISVTRELFRVDFLLSFLQLETRFLLGCYTGLLYLICNSHLLF